MTPDGQFIDQRPETASEKLLRVAAIVAVVAGMAAIAALALWVAFALIPLAIAAGLIAYAAFRWRQWQLRRSAGGQVEPRPPFRP
jgi:uncharacterized membrane protein YdbT with pleckstrin-like domain